MILIETPRLALRRLQEKDLEGFSRIRSNPEVARYQSWTAPFSLEQARQLISMNPDGILGHPGEWFSFAIERKSEPGIIGEFAVHLLGEDERQAMFGFTIDADLQRQGFASEALCAVLDYLFNELKLHRVIAICDVENTASFRLLEKRGFRREAEYVENVWFKGDWGSEYLYALLEREWQALRGSNNI